MNYEQIKNRIHIRLKIYSYGWTAKGPIRRKQLKKAALRYYDSEYWKYTVEKAMLKFAGFRKQRLNAMIGYKKMKEIGGYDLEG